MTLLVTDSGLGGVSVAADVLERSARRGLNLVSEIMVQGALFPDGFFEHPDVQPVLRAMKELHADLAARY